MNVEPVPIERYMNQIFTNPRINAIISEWRVENTQLMQMITGYFKEMGVFYVQPNQTRFIMESTIQILKTSPEISVMVRTAEKQEQDRRKKGA